MVNMIRSYGELQSIISPPKIKKEKSTKPKYSYTLQKSRDLFEKISGKTSFKGKYRSNAQIGKIIKAEARTDKMMSMESPLMKEKGLLRMVSGKIKENKFYERKAKQKETRQQLVKEGKQIYDKTGELIDVSKEKARQAGRFVKESAKINEKTYGKTQKALNTKAMESVGKNRNTYFRELKMRNLERQRRLQVGNKFEQDLINMREGIDKLERNRLQNELPKDFHQRRDGIRQEEMRRRDAFMKKNSLLKAHENLAKVNMDFLETRGSVLMAENVFSASNPRSSDIMNTNRPNILQTQDNIMRPQQDNILNNKHRLRF